MRRSLLLAIERQPLNCWQADHRPARRPLVGGRDLGHKRAALRRGLAPNPQLKMGWINVQEVGLVAGAEACALIVRKLLEYFANQTPEAYLLEPPDSGEAG